MPCCVLSSESVSPCSIDVIWCPPNQSNQQFRIASSPVFRYAAVHSQPSDPRIVWCAQSSAQSPFTGVQFQLQLGLSFIAFLCRVTLQHMQAAIRSRSKEDRKRTKPDTKQKNTNTNETIRNPLTLSFLPIPSYLSPRRRAVFLNAALLPPSWQKEMTSCPPT
jgi:hypothetical protein